MREALQGRAMTRICFYVQTVGIAGTSSAAIARKIDGLYLSSSISTL
jgi:hypothetical protein